MVNDDEPYKPRWTILSIETEAKTHSYDITVVTDIRVHLWLQHASGYRSVRLLFVASRGYSFKCHPTFKFWPAGSIEQEEAGDTLIHTFKLQYDDFRSRFYAKVEATLEGYPTLSNSPTIPLPYFPEGTSSLHVHPNLDTFLNRRYPTTNYGSQTYLILEGRFTGNRQANILLHFPRPSLPEDATIIEATLYLSWLGNSGTPFPATLYRCLQPTWSESTATWRWYSWPDTWDTPGGDYDPSYPPPATSQWPGIPGPLTFDLSSHIQPYYVNEWPLDFLIIPPYKWAWMRFASNESTPHFPYYAPRPKLEITYVVIKDD